MMKGAILSGKPSQAMRMLIALHEGQSPVVDDEGHVAGLRVSPEEKIARRQELARNRASDP